MLPTTDNDLFTGSHEKSLTSSSQMRTFQIHHFLQSLDSILLSLHWHSKAKSHCNKHINCRVEPCDKVFFPLEYSAHSITTKKNLRRSNAISVTYHRVSHIHKHIVADTFCYMNPLFGQISLPLILHARLA